MTEKYWSELYDLSLTGIILVDGNAVIIRANTAFCSMLNRNLSDVVGAPIYDFLDSPNTKIMQSEFRKRLRNQPGHYEVQFLNAQSTPVSCLINAIPINSDYNTVIGSLGMIIDISPRKKAEVELKTSRERYRRLVETNPCGIAVHCRGRICYANPALLHIIGATSRNDVIGRPVMNFVHPSFRAMVTRRIKTSQQDGLVAQTIHEKFIRLDKQIIDVEVTAIPTTHENQPASQVVIRDITEQKRVETALRESEEFSRAVIECSPSGVSVRSPTGRLLSANEAWKRIWGKSDANIAADMQRPRESLHFDDNDTYLKHWHSEIREVYEKGGELYIPEIKITSSIPDAPQWLSQFFYALTDQNGNVQRVVILTADITQRKIQQIAHETRDRILEAVSHAADTLMRVLDPEIGFQITLKELGAATQTSRITIFENRINEDTNDLIIHQLYRWTTPDMKRSPDVSPLHQRAYQSSGLSRWRKLLSNGEVIHGHTDGFPDAESFFLISEKTSYTLLVPITVSNEWWGFIAFDDCKARQNWTFAEIDAVKSAAGVIGSTLQRKKSEQEMRRLNIELEKRIQDRTADLQNANTALKKSLEELHFTQEQLVESGKLAALGNLVAGIAHEINTPVGIGVTAASFLESKTIEFANRIEQETLTLKDMFGFISMTLESTRMILSNLRRSADLIHSFKQVAVDQSSEERRVFNLSKYLDEILLSLHPKLKSTCHIVHVQCSDTININSYPGAFSQIFTNLIMNSLIHGFDGMDEGRIDIIVTPQENRLIIDYRDNGIGASEMIKKRIFEPFFTTKRRSGGSGLGMPIVYNLVTQNLSGTITCEDKIERGMAFCMTIPWDRSPT